MATALTVASLMSGCGKSTSDAGKVQKQAEPAVVQVTDELAEKAVDASAAKQSEDSFSIMVTPDDYSYVVYGRIADYERLTGSDCGVVAIQPLEKGGEPYEGYDWMTCYVAPEVMNQLENTDYDMLDETVAFEMTIRNDVDGGGFIDLPEIMESFKMITVDEIPVWGGA